MPNWAPGNDPEWEDKNGNERGGGAIVWLFVVIVMTVATFIAVKIFLEVIK